MYFNVFDAAPENERDGPSQQAAQNASGRVRLLIPDHCSDRFEWSFINGSYQNTSCRLPIPGRECMGLTDASPVIVLGSRS